MSVPWMDRSWRFLAIYSMSLCDRDAGHHRKENLESLRSSFSRNPASVEGEGRDSRNCGEFHVGLWLREIFPDFPLPGLSPVTWQTTSPTEVSWGHHTSVLLELLLLLQDISNKLVFSKEIMISQKMASLL